ncbi:MAG: glycosyl transferase [Actinobacteria bacterium]|nr:glycosyl transferase [Actinomycetota bacterium]
MPTAPAPAAPARPEPTPPPPPCLVTDHRGRRRDRRPNLTRERRLTTVMIGVTLVAFGLFVTQTAFALDDQPGATGRWFLELFAFTSVVSFLVYGNLVYQFARLGYLRRRHRHRPLTTEELSVAHDRAQPPLCVLVPSYREELRTIRQTLLSAALQEYPNRRVVLLIDDPPEPRDQVAQALLEQARAMPAEIEAQLLAPAERARAHLEDFERRWAGGGGDARDEAGRLAGCAAAAAEWFDDLATTVGIDDHTDAVFVEQVLRTPARDLGALARRLDAVARGGFEAPSEAELRRHYRRLLALFDVQCSAFERKRFVNLSHAPNKAMNLNSYIGLMGRRWRETPAADGLHLCPVEDGPADVVAPAATYLITLDADSLLLPDYALRLVEVMERPQNSRTAVVQTPYSAVPEAPGILERIAGATTDLQYIIHQGFTAYGATFWVGANALLRAAALDDLCVEEEERGFTVRRYIQDRTVIEDTESSVDLVAKGWELTNYPARLSYSATPPDFGALVIQRRRWANGGLIIFPKLVRYLQRRRRFGEAVMRSHYLTSIAGVNVGVLVLLSYPFQDVLQSVWLPLAALPYFLLYTRDLRQAGYHRSDVLRVYALNLLLVPVNLGGVAKSVYQGLTRQKIPFGRTPKVQGRTSVPGLYLLAAVALLLYAAAAACLDVVSGRWAHAVFAGGNAAILFYALDRFVGWRHLLSDAAHRLPGGTRSAGGGPVSQR